MDKDKVRITVDLPRALHRAVKIRALDRRTTIQQLAIEALETALKGKKGGR